MRKQVLNYAGCAFNIQAPIEPWHRELDVLYAADDKAVWKLLLPSENANEESAFPVSLICSLHLCTACLLNGKLLMLPMHSGYCFMRLQKAMSL